MMKAQPRTESVAPMDTTARRPVSWPDDHIFTSASPSRSQSTADAGAAESARTSAASAAEGRVMGRNMGGGGYSEGGERRGSKIVLVGHEGPATSRQLQLSVPYGSLFKRIGVYYEPPVALPTIIYFHLWVCSWVEFT